MLVRVLNVSLTPQCLSHSAILVSLLNVSHTPQCKSHPKLLMLVTLPNVSYNPGGGKMRK